MLEPVRDEWQGTESRKDRHGQVALGEIPEPFGLAGNRRQTRDALAPDTAFVVAEEEGAVLLDGAAEVKPN